MNRRFPKHEIHSFIKLSIKAQQNLKNPSWQNIHGINVQGMTVQVDSSGKIAKYKTTPKLSFGVEH